MLLAEINGKRATTVEGSEDYLTSAVFGHLRQVQDAQFWKAVFRRSVTVGSSSTSLLVEAEQEGVRFGSQCEISFQFWPSYRGYGEPDLLVRFANTSGRSMLLVIEVKLYSQKSSSGPNDQLSRYYDLLQDRIALRELLDDDPWTALIYLTERYSADEVRESVEWSKQPSAEGRMFLLQWQDILEAGVECNPAPDSIIGETVRYLRIRGFEKFHGFATQLVADNSFSGNFYHSEYFRFELTSDKTIRGDFYHG